MLVINTLFGPSLIKQRLCSLKLSRGLTKLDFAKDIVLKKSDSYSDRVHGCAGMGSSNPIVTSVRNAALKTVWKAEKQ